MKNPFRYGEIVTGENFCNRREELNNIHNAINNRYSFWMYSPRRFGKSSLIFKAFETLNNKKIIPLYFDLYNVHNLDDFVRKYSQIIAKGLFNWKTNIENLSKIAYQYFKNLYPKISIDALGTPSLSLEIQKIEEQRDIETVLNIPEQLAGDKQICIAFDEFQEIQRIEPFLNNWMRSAFQKQKKVSYIFSGSKQSLMEYIFTDTNSPFYEYGFKMNIDPISEKDLTNYIKRQFKKTEQNISNNTIKEILSESRCHPHFTQHFASFVWDLILEGEDQENPDFKEKWLKRIVAGQSLIFQNIYDQLSENQRKILFAISVLEEDEKLFSNALRNKYKLPELSSMTTGIKSLAKKNLIQKVNGSYEIINPVFEEWVRSL